MQGPQNLTELRELFRSREYPPGERGQPCAVQTPSDRMREKALALAEIMFGLVPDSEFQGFVGNVLHDLCVIGEAKLCQIRSVEGVEHAELRTQGLRATALGAETLPELSTGSVAVDTVLKQKRKPKA